VDDDFEIDFGSVRDATDAENAAERDALYAAGRRTDRTYASKSFSSAAEPGTPARFVTKVFDPESAAELEPYGDGEQWLVRESPKGRVQIKLLVTRDPGHVVHIWVQRITYMNAGPRAENVLSLQGDDAVRFIELVRNLQYIPVAGEETTRIDDALLREVLSSPGSLPQAYARDPALFRELITNDAAARDVVALARRRAEVDRFRRLIDDDDYFDEQMAATPRQRPEDVWQIFFEQNPWILGTGLSGQLFTSWDETKLEQVVAGASIAQPGKRTDALMRTSGVVRWLTFAELKTHRTELLASTETRPGVWPLHRDVTSGIAQAQATVRRAMQDIDEVIWSTAADGADIPGEMTFLTRPRSFLVVGQLDQLLGDAGGPHRDKIRSFELYRRNLTEPEIVTFDELLARAEWVVDIERS
jgi:hypothetical protein